MKTLKKYFLCLLVLICVLTVTACGKSNDLVGTWDGATEDGLKTTFTFKKDGEVEYKNEYGFNSTGEYKIKENIVTISLKSWQEAKEYKYEIKDKKLSLTATDLYSPSYKEMTKNNK